ncbi:hypothetical protein, variant [Sphaeroforma arctica JP610]|uniref:Uncharacterized protein n=1 Tax=Sphaeroforma arctica JP610 TaxID=667725 RepID=A0A0L0G490_9EUKA|nr:hypothetical protein, variant [Sphaeroforma arctica JP610]KNC83043.1 hypothetical protein, variant [Sphaeroforma arctica JP610]|eukprot:XP_014156945.1 hypothetical protein, variant [Sphaeroforma arctica JP610]
MCIHYRFMQRATLTVTFLLCYTDTNLCYFVGDELYCAATRYGAIDNCAAFISARSFMVIAMIFLCSAMVMLLSGLKYSAADKMSVGFLWTTVVFESITMGCIIGGVYHGTGEGPATTYTVQDNFHLDWSFICFGVAFGLTFLAAIAATGFVAVAPKDEVHFDTPCPNEKPLDV